MKVSKKIKTFAIIVGVFVLILSFLLIFSVARRYNLSEVRLNMSFFRGESDSVLCGGKGYRGNSFYDGLECCGTSKCCSLNGACIKNGCYECE